MSRLSLVIGLAVGLILSEAALAQTSTSQPEVLLDTLPIGDGPELRAQALGSYHRATELIATFEKKFAEGTAQLSDVRSIGDAAAESLRLGHVAMRLQAIGEALSADLQLRGGQLSVRIKNATRQAQRVPGFRLDVLQRELDALFKAQEVRVPYYRQQVAAGKLLETEQALVLVLCEIHRYAVFFDTDVGKYYQPFRGLLNEFQPALNARRWQEQAEALEEATVQPRLEQLGAALARCTKELEQGVCQWSGRECTAVQLVEGLSEDLKRIQLATLRARGWQLAAIPPGSSAPDQAPAVDKLHADLLAALPGHIQAIITVDVAQTKPADATRVYQAWLVALARLGLGTWDQATIAKFQAALDPLVAKGTELPKQVAQYQAATDDYLRWRQRVTSAQAAKLQKTCPPLINIVTPVARAHDGGQYLISDRSSLKEAAVMMPLNEVAREFAAKLVGQSGTVPQVFAQAGAGWGTSRYQDRLYASLALPAASQLVEQVQRLRERLLCSPTDQPLSLRAALCIAAADQGYFQHVGGTLREVRILPVSAGYALLWDQQAAIAPCSDLPQELFHLDLHEHVMIETHLEPTWVQHEAFVTLLPVSAPSP